ncbi:hypothetical protein GA0115253_107441, partial [Streptomyces sp. Termitarium-T10T-6]
MAERAEAQGEIEGGREGQGAGVGPHPVHCRSLCHRCLACRFLCRRSL